MTTNTHLALAHGAKIHFNDPGESYEFWPEQLDAYALAVIQQAAAAVPEDMSCPGCLVGTLHRRLLKSKNRVLAAKVCDNCKIELFGQEQSEYNKNSRDVSTPSPLGREAGKEGSSDHLVPCAGDRVQVPLSDANLAKRAKIGAMLTDDNGKISMYPAEYRRILEGRYIRAFRDAEAAHGITAPAPRPDAPTSQINHGSAPREDGDE